MYSVLTCKTNIVHVVMFYVFLLKLTVYVHVRTACPVRCQCVIICFLLLICYFDEKNKRRRCHAVRMKESGHYVDVDAVSPAVNTAGRWLFLALTAGHAVTASGWPLTGGPSAISGAMVVRSAPCRGTGSEKWRHRRPRTSAVVKTTVISFALTAYRRTPCHVVCKTYRNRTSSSDVA